MPNTIRHKGFGKWFVVDGDADVAGPMTKPEAEAYLASEVPAPAEVPDSEADERRKRLEWERKLDRSLTQQKLDHQAKLAAFIIAEYGYDEATAERLAMQVAPMLEAGAQGLMRTLKHRRMLASA